MERGEENEEMNELNQKKELFRIPVRKKEIGNKIGKMNIGKIRRKEFRMEVNSTGEGELVKGKIGEE